MWDDDSSCGIDMDFDGDTDFADDALYFQLLQELEEKEKKNQLELYSLMDNEDDEDWILEEDEDGWLFGEENDDDYDDGDWEF